MRIHKWKLKCKMSSSPSDITFLVRWHTSTQLKAILNYAGAHLLFRTHTKNFQNHNFPNSKWARKRIMHLPYINFKWKMENGNWKKAKYRMAKSHLKLERKVNIKYECMTKFYCYTKVENRQFRELLNQFKRR